MPPAAAIRDDAFSAAALPIWAAPDATLAAAGAEGELLASRIRVPIVGLLLIVPTWKVVFLPYESANVNTLFIGSIIAAIVIVIWLVLERGARRSWIGFATSAFDVTAVSAVLLTFFVAVSPLQGLNRGLTFELYFLALMATCLRNDTRICLAAGTLALAQYGALWIAGAVGSDLNDPSFVAKAGPYIPTDLATRLLLLVLATLTAVMIVHRAQRVLYLAARDRLTGLYNRGHFDRALEQAVGSAMRHPLPLSLVILDIDYFKRINDDHGHARGDQALRTLAQRLATAMRSTDLVARYGGEEFVVLMTGTPPEAALARIEAMRVTVAGETLTTRKGDSFVLNFSAGVAGTPTDSCFAPDASVSDAAEVLLVLADERLLAAKRAGRGRCFGPETVLHERPPLRRSLGEERLRRSSEHRAQ